MDIFWNHIINHFASCLNIFVMFFYKCSNCIDLTPRGSQAVLDEILNNKKCISSQPYNQPGIIILFLVLINVVYDKI